MSVPDSFRKARRQYGLYSSLLIIWELAAFDVSEFKYNGIIIGQSIAIPYILLALLIYSAYRFRTEWTYYGDDASKTEKQVSQVNYDITKDDYLVSHGIALTALIVFIVFEYFI